MAKTKKTPLPKVEGFHFNDKAHAYTLDGKPLMGVTSVLGVISKPALIAWSSKMACEHIRENVAYVIAGQDGGFWAVKPSVVEDAQKAYAKKRDTAADAGTDLHALVETYVLYAIENHDGQPLGAFPDAIASFVQWAQKENIRFLSSEQRMYHKELGIAGTADLVFEKDGKTYIGDVKTYKKIWDRVPFIQCAAYGLMWEAMHEINRNDKGELGINIERPIDGYCIIRIKDSEFETMWSYDRGGDTEAFLSALRLYKHLKNFAR